MRRNNSSLSQMSFISFWFFPPGGNFIAFCIRISVVDNDEIAQHIYVVACASDCVKPKRPYNFYLLRRNDSIDSRRSQKYEKRTRKKNPNNETDKSLN